MDGLQVLAGADRVCGEPRLLGARVEGDTFALIEYTGARSGTFGSETLPALVPGLSWTLVYDDLHRDVVLEVTGTATNVPEPATLALVAGGIVGVLG